MPHDGVCWLCVWSRDCNLEASIVGVVGLLKPTSRIWTVTGNVRKGDEA